MLFDQDTIDNTEKNHRQECGLRGPHSQCDLCIVPPIKLFSFEEPPRRSSITFCPQVLVKPIAHHADIKRRGGEWETLRESLDREDEYLLSLNDEEPEEGEDIDMIRQQFTPHEDCGDGSDVDILPEEQAGVATEIYYDGLEGSETAETPPNDAGVNDIGIEMLENQSEHDRISEDGNGIVQHTGGIVVGVHVFVSGPTEGCGAPWSAESKETQRVDGFGVRPSCGILSNRAKDGEEKLLVAEVGRESPPKAGDCDWKAAATDDNSDEMVANDVVTVESLAVSNDESLPGTALLDGEMEQDKPFFEKRHDGESLFLAEDWDMADGTGDSDEIPVVASPAHTLESPALSKNQESLPDTQLQGGTADQTKVTEGLSPFVPGNQERKRSNPSDITGGTASYAQSRAPSWVIKRRKIYPNIFCNRYQNQQS